MISKFRHGDEFLYEYVTLLLQLHELIRLGKGEADEAEIIRDQMDHWWKCLRPEQISLVDGLSEDLYTIGIDRTLTHDVTPPDAATFEVAVKSENWVDALRIVREYERQLPPAEVAFVRGVCWAHIGEPNVAVEFFRETSRLGQLDASREIWLLTCMVQAGRAADVAERAREIIEDSKNPLLLLHAATVLSVRAGEIDDASEGQTLRQDAIRAAYCGLQHVDTVSPEDKEMLDVTLVGSYLHLAMNHDELGEVTQAREACAKARELDPTNVDALMLQGWLNREEDPATASADFHRGFGQRLTAQLGLSLPTATTNVSGSRE